MIKLFAGLGNPGAQYEQSRHNAGFWWIDHAADVLTVSLAPRASFHGQVAQTRLAGHNVWLLQPRTFMNRSGQSVAALARFYKIQPEEILVVHDELDLPPGTARLKHGGGHGGHNGLRDIHSQLGSADYWRLRLGIGHPGSGQDVTGWVLGRPQSSDFDAIAEAIRETVKHLEPLAAGQMDRATRDIHTRLRQTEAPGADPQ